jgi:hypothetical protein
MTGSGMLTGDAIRLIYKAAVDAGLHRQALLADLDPAVRAILEQDATVSGQLFMDLQKLNRMGRLLDGSIPLRTWLETAELLAGPQREAKVFKRALAKLELVAALLVDATITLTASPLAAGARVTSEAPPPSPPAQPAQLTPLTPPTLFTPPTSFTPLTPPPPAVAPAVERLGIRPPFNGECYGIFPGISGAVDPVHLPSPSPPIITELPFSACADTPCAAPATLLSPQAESPSVTPKSREPAEDAITAATQIFSRPRAAEFSVSRVRWEPYISWAVPEALALAVLGHVVEVPWLLKSTLVNRNAALVSVVEMGLLLLIGLGSWWVMRPKRDLPEGVMASAAFIAGLLVALLLIEARALSQVLLAGDGWRDHQTRPEAYENILISGLVWPLGLGFGAAWFAAASGAGWRRRGPERSPA